MSDREIREQVRAGALSAEDLAARCRAGTRCGGCRSVVDAIVAEERVSIRRPLVAA